MARYVRHEASCLSLTGTFADMIWLLKSFCWGILLIIKLIYVLCSMEEHVLAKLNIWWETRLGRWEIFQERGMDFHANSRLPKKFTFVCKNLETADILSGSLSWASAWHGLNSWEPPNNFGIISMLHTHTHTHSSHQSIWIYWIGALFKSCVYLYCHTPGKLALTIEP